MTKLREAQNTAIEQSMVMSVSTEQNNVFDVEFLPLADDLYNFAFHLTYSDSDAQDLVQETFLKAFRFLSSYKKGTNAKAWLFRILKNAFINDYRKKNRRPKEVDYEEGIGYSNTEDDKYVGFLDLREDIYKDMMGDELTKALNELPVDFRTVVILSDVEGFTYEEIGKIVGIPIGTVRSRLFRARNLLKEKLRDYAKTLGIKEKR